MTASSLFSCKAIAELPPMSWVIVVRPGRQAELWHGTSVLAAPEWFAEGAWSDSCDMRGLEAAPYLLGTGGTTRNGEIVLRCASHGLERLWAVVDGGALVASNSLPLVMAAGNARLKFSHPFYESDFLTFIRGPQGLKRSVPLAGGRRLQQFQCGRVFIDGSLTIRFEAYNNKHEFETFDAYRDHLRDLSTLIARNAVDARRPRTYAPLATISRGYDSPACAVLAKEMGATAGITFAEARDGFRASVDDGSEIGRMLDLTMFRFDRRAYRTGNGHPEKIFLASGGGGEDVVLHAASERLQGSLLLTGVLGDTVWALESDPAASERGRFPYPSGGSLAEFRLATDFVHFPVPMSDLSSHRSIQRISRSPEMRDWRVGGTYDRPIPRRIAEAAGIPRALFGTSKMAITAPMYYDRPIDTILGPAAEKEYREFFTRNGRSSRRVGSVVRHKAAESIHWLRTRVAWRLGDLPRTLRPYFAWIAPDLASRGRRRLTESSMLVVWAVTAIEDAYRRVLEKTGVIAPERNGGQKGDLPGA